MLTAFRGSRRINPSLALNTCHYWCFLNSLRGLVGPSQHLHTGYLRTCMSNLVISLFKGILGPAQRALPETLRNLIWQLHVSVRQTLAVQTVLCSGSKGGGFFFFFCIIAMSDSCMENILINSVIFLLGSFFWARNVGTEQGVVVIEPLQAQLGGHLVERLMELGSALYERGMQD